MVKWAVIGVGPWGTKVAAAIQALGFECCELSGRSGVSGSEYNRVVQWADIVFIATHPVCCVEMARHALSNGKLTIVEKPVGFDAREVKDLLDLSRANKVPLIVDYVHLFNQSVLALKHEGLRLLRVKLGGNGPVRDYDALWDYGSHAVAIAMEFLGAPSELQVVRLVDGEFEIHLTFENGQRAFLEISNSYKSRAARISVSTDSYDRTYDDVGTARPLQNLIAFAVRLHLRGEYWTNGALAVEVTDVLERLHAMLPK